MARLIFRNGPFAGKALTLPEGKTLNIGRNRDLELPLPDLRLSRKHCQIEVGALGVIVRDLASTNGTFVNGERLETEVRLKHLDIILIGDTEIEFQMPEDAIDLEQTHVGTAASAPAPAAPVRVSPALEPATGVSTASPLAAPPAQIPVEHPATAAVAPVAIPSAKAAAATDPLAVAIAELDMPLPPEPSVDLPSRPQVAFCDQCNGSIPIVDVDLCIAKEIEGKLYCRECMAKGVPGGKSGDWSSQDRWGKPASNKDIDDILKGLDQVEEIHLEDNAARRAHAPAHPEGHTSRQAPVSGPPKTESAFERLLNDDPEPPKAKPKAPPPKIDDLLGDEFEEIG